jgi:hypothetical protein
MYWYQRRSRLLGVQATPPGYRKAALPPILVFQAMYVSMATAESKTGEYCRTSSPNATASPCWPAAPPAPLPLAPQAWLPL